MEKERTCFPVICEENRRFDPRPWQLSQRNKGHGPCDKEPKGHDREQAVSVLIVFSIVLKSRPSPKPKGRRGCL